MIKQISKLTVEIQGHEISLLCGNDTPLGCLHDALMQMKGWTVEKMIHAQKEEEHAAQEHMKQNPSEEE